MLLSHRGEGGGGAADGFLQLLGGAAGGGGGGEGGASSTSNIVKILLGLAKSYFNVKSGSSPAIQVLLNIPRLAQKGSTSSMKSYQSSHY